MFRQLFIHENADETRLMDPDHRLTTRLSEVNLMVGSLLMGNMFSSMDAGTVSTMRSGREYERNDGQLVHGHCFFHDSLLLAISSRPFLWSGSRSPGRKRSQGLGCGSQRTIINKLPQHVPWDSSSLGIRTCYLPGESFFIFRLKARRG